MIGQRFGQPQHIFIFPFGVPQNLYLSLQLQVHSPRAATKTLWDHLLCTLKQKKPQKDMNNIIEFIQWLFVKTNEAV